MLVVELLRCLMCCSLLHNTCLYFMFTAFRFTVYCMRIGQSCDFGTLCFYMFYSFVDALYYSAYAILCQFLYKLPWPLGHRHRSDLGNMWYATYMLSSFVSCHWGALACCMLTLFRYFSSSLLCNIYVDLCHKCDMTCHPV